MLITISGLPGTGTTTLSRLVADALGLERVPGGEVFRQLAAEAGMTLAEFGVHAQGHPEIDRELDRRLTERAGVGGCVIESRLAGWLVTRAELPGLRAWVQCSEPVRAERVGLRDGIPVAQAQDENRERAALERVRYLEFYGIDIDDLSIYDVLLDSSTAAPEVLASQILALVTPPG